MTYDVIKGELGKDPFYLLEFAMRSCSNVVRDGVGAGVGKCEYDPALGLACFNTFGTCGDTPNFDAANPSLDTELTYRLSSKRLDSLQGPNEPPTFPILKSIVTTPTKLTTGKGLGIRSTLSVSVEDFPFNDTGIDPYLSERLYDPEDQGSYWGKFLSRNPFYEGALATLYTGYLEDDGTFDLSNFKSRSYILHRITGPNYMGAVSLEFKDPLKATDTDRAQWPPPTTASLNGNIDDTVTTFTVDDPQGDMAQWFVDQPTQEHIIIDEEIMEVVTIVPLVNQLQFTVVRASMPSIYVASTNIAAEHAALASVQQCYLYDGLRIDDTIYQLCNEAARIDAAFLPLADWQAEINSSGYISYVMNRLLVKPTGVKKLLEELTKLNVYIWWDEREQEVPLKTLLLSTSGAPVYDESNNIIDGSIDITRDVKDRVSRVLFGYGISNPTFDEKKQVSYQAIEYKVALNAESEFEYGQQKTAATYSQWLTNVQRPVASEIASRFLVANRDTKQIASLTLTPKDDAQWTGDIIALNTRLMQDAYGANQETNFQIIEVRENLSVSDVTYSYVLQELASVVRAGVITPTTDPDAALQFDADQIQFDADDVTFGSASGTGTFPDYPDASVVQQSHYAFIAYDHAPDPPADPTSPAGFNDGTPAYVVV